MLAVDEFFLVGCLLMCVCGDESRPCCRGLRTVEASLLWKGAEIRVVIVRFVVTVCQLLRTQPPLTTHIGDIGDNRPFFVVSSNIGDNHPVFFISIISFRQRHGLSSYSVALRCGVVKEKCFTTSNLHSTMFFAMNGGRVVLGGTKGRKVTSAHTLESIRRNTVGKNESDSLLWRRAAA